MDTVPHLRVKIHIYLLLFIFVPFYITNTCTIYISSFYSRSGSGSGTLWKTLLFGIRNRLFKILAVVLTNFATLLLLHLSCYLSSWLVVNDLCFVSGGQPDLRVLVTRRSEVGSRRQQVSLLDKEDKEKNAGKHSLFEQFIRNFLKCVNTTSIYFFTTRTNIKMRIWLNNVNWYPPTGVPSYLLVFG